MKRTVFLSGAAAFIMAFFGTVLASAVAVPAVVGAQEARIRAEQLTLVGANGADRVNLLTQPGIQARVAVADTNGVSRVQMGTGGGAAGDDPDNAGLGVFLADGTPVIRLGMGHGRALDQALRNNLNLNDWQGNTRIALRIDESGTPSIQMLDATGKVTWEAK